MSTETTPAIERGGNALERWTSPPAGTDHEAADETSTPRDAARVVLSAALDVEEMARVLQAASGSPVMWETCTTRARSAYRSQARALRASILGGAR